MCLLCEMGDNETRVASDLVKYNYFMALLYDFKEFGALLIRFIAVNCFLIL